MTLLKSCVIAFSTYSAIPMPRVEWSGKNRRFAICFFPLVGVVIGAAVMLAYRLWLVLRLVTGLGAVVLTLLPVLLSGGIHMDGWVDVWDALASRQDRESMLKILKDPHTGAFGVMGCAAYLLLSCGLWLQVLETPACFSFVVIGYAASRALSGIGVATIACAKNSGLLHAFVDGSARRVVAAVCVLWLFLCGTAWIWLDREIGLVFSLTALLGGVLYRAFCRRVFGGNTGDLSGFYLQLNELAFLLLAAVCGAGIG